MKEGKLLAVKYRDESGDDETCRQLHPKYRDDKIHCLRLPDLVTTDQANRDQGEGNGPVEGQTNAHREDVASIVPV